MHTDGVGQSFYDCDAPGTYTEASALEACAAYAATVVGGTAANCSGGWTCTQVPSALEVCYAKTGGAICENYCWAYAGTIAGTVVSCSTCVVATATWN